MSTVTQVSVIEFTPLVDYIEALLTEKFFSVSESKVVRILEIGCGPGDFALTLKQRLGTKINYTGLDPSDDIDKAKAKLNGSDIDFIKGDLFEHQFDSKYDVVLFTKSLHHCNPVEKAVKIAYDLLEQNGIFFAEEFNPDRLNTQDKYWHIERLDLLLATGCFIPAEERLENAGHIKKFLSAFLDTRLPVEERFMLGRNHHHQHGDQHHHGHGGHPSAHEDQQHTHGDHQLHHSHEQKEHNKKLHRDDPEGIAPFNQVISVVEKQFGKDIVKSMSVPFFYHFLVLSGLKDNEAGQAGLREYMKQEQRAIDEKKIHPLGLNILAYKNPV